MPLPRILAIHAHPDDIEIQCAGTLARLKRLGCEVVLAEDGFDGLSKVVDNKPDVIFVDVMMPRLDGYQTCALIKNHQDFKNTPVIMLTSKDSLFDRARGKLVG